MNLAVGFVALLAHSPDSVRRWAITTTPQTRLASQPPIVRGDLVTVGPIRTGRPRGRSTPLGRTYKHLMGELLATYFGRAGVSWRDARFS